MSAINRAQLAEHLWPGIINWFGMEYKDYPMQYSDMFDTVNSRKAYEEYVMESAFGLAPVKEAGAPTIFDDAGDVWKGRVEMVAYALGFVITREAVADDQYFDLVPKYTKALKRSMVITKEVRGASFLAGVFTTSMTGDGSPVCASDHPLNKIGTTWSNVSAVNSDLNETSLEAALIQIANFTDEKGLNISVMGKRLVVPNGTQFTAERVTTASLRPGTGDNDPNAIRNMGLIPEGYRVNNYLKNPSAWFIKTDTGAGEGMTHWEREPLDVDQGDGLDNQVMKVIAYERYAFACGDPRGIWGDPGQPQV